jgi:protein disulfide-isomerase
MYRILRLLFALSVAAPALFGAEGWLTDLKTAQETAQAEKKTVLMNFTGSDWCVWCFRLRDEVFATKEFKAYAAKNLVLLEVDFPRKNNQSAALRQTNQGLQKQYQIRGYPTLIVLDPGLKKAGQLGYMPGGPKAFIAALEKLRK